MQNKGKQNKTKRNISGGRSCREKEIANEGRKRITEGGGKYDQNVLNTHMK